MKSAMKFPKGPAFTKKVLDDITREHFTLTEAAAEEVTDEMLRDAAAHAPVATGTLRKSARKYKARTRGKGTKFRQFNQIKMTFGVRRRKRKKSKRDKGRADYAAIVHNDPNLKIRSGEHQFLFKAVGRKQQRLTARIRARWRAR